MNSENSHPRVLVISHNCFSENGSNGRTLGNFFSGWPQESLGQFYINNEIPDSPVCDKYFRVLDTEALTAFIKGNRVGRVIRRETEITATEEDDMSLGALYKKHRKRSSLNYMVRNLIWDSQRWKGREFEAWIDEFSPQVVLLQLGDYSFMLRVALDIAEKRHIPLVIYNSEDYYFKDRRSLSPLYHFYRYDYKRQVRKLISYASCSIYISEMLQETYLNAFNHRSTVIMTATDVIPAVEKGVNNPVVVSYLGNLGVGRHEPLIEVAKALNEVFPGICLDIYGTPPTEDIEQDLSACASIRLKGFVPYDEVIRVMQHSDLLVHVENFSKFYQWDLKHAFSTKIPDSLACGTCLLAYGPAGITSIEYLKDNGAAAVVTEQNELQGTLREVINNADIRQAYINTALKLAHKRHNLEENARHFALVIKGVVNESCGIRT